MLFTISRDGVIYLNAPLDRETQDQFHISIVVERPDGREIAKPVELRVMVGDANDNRPTFPQTQYHAAVKELAVKGTEILTVQAADNDDPKTDNVRIFYRLVGQVPESPRTLFRVDRDSGVISLLANSMEGTSPQYTLTITAEDAKGLNSSCTVIITVQDENNNPPVFSQHEYGPFYLAEDAEVGTTVTTVCAWDADERGGDSWLVDYRLESGNEDEVFTLVTDSQTNEVSLVLDKVLDFERESEYILVVSAQNPVGLVRGRYGPASTATVSIFVDDINEGPVLSQSHYEVTVREGEEPGRVIATIRGYDPDSHPIRYSLRGDTKRYFSIGKYSGELKTVQALDREENSTYTMEVVAEDGRNSSLSASTLVTVHILDVNDNSPVLVGDYSWKHLCTPRWDEQALVLASRDSDSPQHGGRLNFSLRADATALVLASRDSPQHGGRLNFSLRADATVRRNWKLMATSPPPRSHPLSPSSLPTPTPLSIPAPLPPLPPTPPTTAPYPPYSPHPPYRCPPTPRPAPPLPLPPYPETCPPHCCPPTLRPAPPLPLPPYPDLHPHLCSVPPQRFSGVSRCPLVTWAKYVPLLAAGDTHTNLSLNTPYLAPEVYTVPFTISDSSSPPRSTFINLPVTVCTCNVRGYCRMAAKQLEGMPTVQSTVGILVGTLAVIGIILIVVFMRISYQNPKPPSKTSQERVPLSISL
ncbi:hypothetical protein ACEWY4_015552 [Coilia grayii]|uniref:Cadherin domain-containing protein n=1 Tax=Coilia grayii TaxID=363190 RepID=A0ABD1JPZ5_9TELE